MSRNVPAKARRKPLPVAWEWLGHTFTAWQLVGIISGAVGLTGLTLAGLWGWWYGLPLFPRLLTFAAFLGLALVSLAFLVSRLAQLFRGGHAQFPVTVSCGAMSSGAEPWGVHQKFVVRVKDVHITNQSPDQAMSLEISMLLGAGIMSPHPERLNLDPQSSRHIPEIVGGEHMLLPKGPTVKDLQAREVILILKDHVSNRSRAFKWPGIEV